MKNICIWWSLRLTYFLLIGLLCGFVNSDPPIGSQIDSYNGVRVFFNGRNYKRVEGRNVTSDGYNLGLRFQCVEFAKRYYFERFGHRMPNSYGHAKEFFDKGLGDVGFNKNRGMWQFRNTRDTKPEVEDLIVYDAHQGNPYGHLAIVTEVGDDYVEIIQQNKRLDSRQKLPLSKYLTYYTIADYNIVGWLRMSSN